jgi:hypothetical protein
MTESMIYDLNDVRNIFENGFSYLLSSETINHIKKIESELGIVHNHVPVKTYDKRPIATNSSTTNHHRNNRKEDLSWENVRNFKTTKMDKKEGLEKKINDVRICINKMSAKNYDLQRDTIFAFILEINQEEDSESLEKIANAIFDIASTNKFYSEMYARLYRELIHVYPIFQKVMDVFLHKYMDSLKEIKYADPNVDYDLFCVYTKQSDKRKATAQFLVHMMREKILSQEYILSIMVDLIEKVKENMDMDGKMNEVEEFTELVNIFVSQSMDVIVLTSGLTDNIRAFAKYKLKDKKSLSSRILFKYTDLVTLIDKKI